ncbi:flavoprotein [Afifella marina]|uniref:Flavoprotein n=1 Tax=Afifella marina DSM 2698 TaxID=1120955 RepID=A0A1G5NUZ2_AFIMA|nr:flavoprotein [Afifella marina]MBK1624074.1 hypothetical protein [Afifella marina DSM 2698]MBK1627631.1 hypothetical protein [Afifella marina]MBK5916355.1 hypothetical protein [Afifella marina]RAI20917.1 hypothetical protein CH311_08250 [Afifella marina DSM 2698]SCZ41064.1 Flavoprotein [Afifella marina DSM 2698]
MDEAIADMVVARVMAQLEGETLDTSPRRVVMLLSGAASGFYAAREGIRRLSASKHELKVLMTPGAQHVLTEDLVRQEGAKTILPYDPWLDVPELIKECDLLLVPCLTMNLAGRLALGLMDSPATTLFLGVLLAGKPVIAIRNGADPADKRGEVMGSRPDGSPVLWSLLQEYLARLAAFGAEMVDKQDFLMRMERRLVTSPQLTGGAATVPQPSAPVAARISNAVTPASKFVTANELLGLAPGSSISLAPGQALTAQARDAVERLHLKLVAV